jgi:hypothetical protein
LDETRITPMPRMQGPAAWLRQAAGPCLSCRNAHRLIGVIRAIRVPFSNILRGPLLFLGKVSQHTAGPAMRA